MSVIEVTEDNFDEMVSDHDGVVVVDFWAPWCGPCRAVAPIIEELSEEYGEKVRFTKVNVDENQEIASFFGIRSIPTIGFFKGGETAGAVVGAHPKHRLKEAIDKIMSEE